MPADPTTLAPLTAAELDALQQLVDADASRGYSTTVAPLTFDMKRLLSAAREAERLPEENATRIREMWEAATGSPDTGGCHTGYIEGLKRYRSDAAAWKARAERAEALLRESNDVLVWAWMNGCICDDPSVHDTGCRFKEAHALIGDTGKIATILAAAERAAKETKP